MFTIWPYSAHKLCRECEAAQQKRRDGNLEKNFLNILRQRNSSFNLCMKHDVIIYIMYVFVCGGS